MGDENSIRTLEDYSSPSYEGYRNTIELPDRNNVVPLRSDTIRLVQNGCSFHELRSEDPNQHLKDFLKLVDSLDLDDPSLPGRIILLVSLLNSFHRKRLKNSKMTTRCSNNIKVNLFLKHGLVSRTYSKKSLIMASIFGSKSKSFMTMSIPPQGEPSISRSVNDPRDFAKLVKAISLPQDVSSTSDLRLIELENQVQRLMEAHLAPKSSVQQTFVDYASSSIAEAGGKWFTFKHEQNYLGDTYNPSWKSHPNLRRRQPQNSQNNFSNPPNRLVPNFIASQDARLSKFEADFKQQQDEMTSKIDTVLKAINDRITGALTSDIVKNPKLNVNSASLVLIALLAHAPIYNAMLDKYVESLELGKNGSAFIQGKMPEKIKDPLFTLPCSLEESKPFDTLADLGSCVNLIPLYLFKKLKIGFLEETDRVFGLVDGTKSYPVGIVKNVEVHIGRLKLLDDLYVIDMDKDPATSLLVERGFLATANAIIDCRKAKIAVEGVTRSIFGVKEIDLGEEEVPYWTTLGKRESYTPRSSTDGIGARPPYYTKKDFIDYHVSGE
ncbi:MAK10-like protein [Tanacetum coccineum]